VLFGKPRSAVAGVLDRAGIADIGGRLVGKCSGGQQQRLRFARAVLPDPELLNLDEPTTGMDVGGRHDLWKPPRSAATPSICTGGTPTPGPRRSVSRSTRVG
jgi:ABC-2 type transport system ATP-binding protein